MRTLTTVSSVRTTEADFTRDHSGDFHGRTLVLAAALQTPSIPALRPAVRIGPCFTPFEYRHPGQLPRGVLVVGASATGVQLAHEIHQSAGPDARVGEHVRCRDLSRRDVLWWMGCRASGTSATTRSTI